jgi:hypothetical protein
MLARGQRSIPGHSPRNDRRELPAIILDLRFECRNTRFPSTQRRAITLEHPQRRKKVIPRVRECPLAFSRRGFKLLLPQLERLRPNLNLGVAYFSCRK